MLLAPQLAFGYLPASFHPKPTWRGGWWNPGQLRLLTWVPGRVGCLLLLDFVAVFWEVHGDTPRSCVFTGWQPFFLPGRSLWCSAHLCSRPCRWESGNERLSSPVTSASRESRAAHGDAARLRPPVLGLEAGKCQLHFRRLRQGEEDPQTVLRILSLCFSAMVSFFIIFMGVFVSFLISFLIENMYSQ